MYKILIRPFLFLLSPEKIHKLVWSILKIFDNGFGRFILSSIFEDKKFNKNLTVGGINLRNPIGIAAGLDKDAELLNLWQCFGFGFIEVGTVTPLAQPGNPKPRLFRIKSDKALINRMGFNNKGVQYMAKKLANRKTTIPIGVNIGKNKNTPNNDAHTDYVKCVEALYPYADFFIVNVSSPNTPGLRELMDKEPLTKILTQTQEAIKKAGPPKPLWLKIAPDLSPTDIENIAQVCQLTNISAIVATNTTISRDALSDNGKALAQQIGAGGLSGQPIKNLSDQILDQFAKQLPPHVNLVGCGGIFNHHHAQHKLNLGAKAIEVYTAFIYEGPGLAKKILARL